MRRLTIYSKPDCHLCDDMKALVRRVLADRPEVSPEVSYEEVDISTDPALDAQYGLEIPVLMVNGKKTAKYRVSEADLRRALVE